MKFINDSDAIVEDVIAGFTAAYGDRLVKVAGANVISRRTRETGVGVVIGNGSVHEPACIGFVGRNMLSANAYGELFSAPDSDTIVAAIRAADSGRGVLLLISNHEGDVLNGRLAVKKARKEGHEVEAVILHDDISSAPPTERTSRRGTAGTLFSYKMVGAYGQNATELASVKEVAERVNERAVCLSAALHAGFSPVDGREMFQVPEGSVVIGLGVHGEAARDTERFEGARVTAELMAGRLVEDAGIEAGDEVAVVVNSAGRTTDMELFVFYGAVSDTLRSLGITPVRPLIGRFVTTQDMSGISLGLCKLDDALKKLWEAPTNAPALNHNPVVG
jgi:phosphoenolpyruvate---glycerone phosphotransferase subunit DhaK